MHFDALSFLIAPFCMCLVLVGIHCYLGLHVLARGVIFVDLSLAQVAAFGATFALLLGFEHDSFPEYLMALVSTFIGAGLFALARRYEKRLAQEAIIGIVYALGSAGVILAVDKMAHGSEHIRDLLVGEVLWVTWPQVIKTTAIYSVVGAIHYIFRKQFFAASFSKQAANRGWWDFLFYALFGVVITSSVSIAGVLQVFTYLIVPAVVGSFLFTTLRAKLFFGWGLGFVLSLFGMSLSYFLDLPSGATIVVCFTLVPVLVLLGLGLRFLLHNK